MLRQVYSAEEVQRLMAACNGGFTGKRNATIICLLYRTGIRCGEMLQLELQDPDLELGRLSVRKAKGGKQRAVPLDSFAQEALEGYLAHRKRVIISLGSPLFCTLEGRPLWDSYIRTMLRRMGQRAGIQKRVHAHGLRYTFATELGLEGYPIHQIRDLLGHESIATTNLYIAAGQVDLSGRAWGTK
jgi:site-specific recombinase XerD